MPSTTASTAATQGHPRTAAALEPREGACDMNRRQGTRPLAGAHRLIGLVLALAPLPAAAQIGPLTNQSLFFDQASTPHGGNYLAADAGPIYPDNVSRAANGSGDTLALLGLVGNASREGPRLDYRLASDLALVKYLHAAYQTQPFGYLDGTGDIGIVPGSFSWTGRSEEHTSELQSQSNLVCRL